MPIFIRLARLTEKANQDLVNMERMVAEAQRVMEENGARILHAYVTLGDYDIISIIEAPDQTTAAKISALLAHQGNFRAETLSAIPLEEFLTTLKSKKTSE
jgi:uncharacterized protein with GYD domain